jgi:hypothetical protein
LLADERYSRLKLYLGDHCGIGARQLRRDIDGTLGSELQIATALCLQSDCAARQWIGDRRISSDK